MDYMQSLSVITQKASLPNVTHMNGYLISGFTYDYTSSGDLICQYGHCASVDCVCAHWNFFFRNITKYCAVSRRIVKISKSSKLIIIRGVSINSFLLNVKGVSRIGTEEDSCMIKSFEQPDLMQDGLYKVSSKTKHSMIQN